LITYEPDILTRGLGVVFCGLDPAASAAAAGDNFSSRSNRFCKVLHRAGFTDVPLQAHEERRLLDYGCGITAVVGRPTQRADEVCRWKNSKRPNRIQSQDSALCPALDRLSWQARRVGDDRAASSRLGSASQRIRRDDGLDSAQSERPQQELYARCSRRSLHRISDNALRRRPGTNALSDVTVRAVRWPALQERSVTPGWMRRDGTFEAADHGIRGIGRQIIVAALAIGSKL